MTKVSPGLVNSGLSISPVVITNPDQGHHQNGGFQPTEKSYMPDSHQGPSCVQAVYVMQVKVKIRYTDTGRQWPYATLK